MGSKLEGGVGVWNVSQGIDGNMNMRMTVVGCSF